MVSMGPTITDHNVNSAHSPIFLMFIHSYSPYSICRFYWSIIIRGTILELLYVCISDDTLYFRYPDEILAFITLELWLFRVCNLGKYHFYR